MPLSFGGNSRICLWPELSVEYVCPESFRNLLPKLLPRDNPFKGLCFIDINPRLYPCQGRRILGVTPERALMNKQAEWLEATCWLRTIWRPNHLMWPAEWSNLI